MIYAELYSSARCCVYGYFYVMCHIQRRRATGSIVCVCVPSAKFITAHSTCAPSHMPVICIRLNIEKKSTVSEGMCRAHGSACVTLSFSISMMTQFYKKYHKILRVYGTGAAATVLMVSSVRVHTIAQEYLKPPSPHCMYYQIPALNPCV